MKPTVISDVVKNNLCIGCGLCAALCPQGNLAMTWNRYGEYNPVEVKPCNTECGLCLKVCPFIDTNENEDAIGERLYESIPRIRHRRETGYYLESYVGYSERYRPMSASGGIATWVLEEILAGDIVDFIICVTPTGNPDRLFSFQIFSSPRDVRSRSGSVYYPVEMSDIIRHIINVPGRYAITGIPCFIKAIRLAQQRNKLLHQRIIVTLGLVCGQMKSRHFTEYIADLAGIGGKVTGVQYRGKSPDQPASNFYFNFITVNGEQKRIFWRDGISEAWTNRWFTPNACNYCDDVFAECADIACMDAWLPEYMGESEGTSLVLVRSPLVQKIIEEGNDLSLHSIPVEKVIQSQGGVLAVKRQHLAHRLYLDHMKGVTVPKKRVDQKRSRNPFLRQEVVLKERMRKISRETWITGVHDLESFRQTMQPDLKRLQISNRVSRVIIHPFRIIRKAMQGICHE